MVLQQRVRSSHRQRRPWPRQRYAPLAAWLADQSTDAVTCTFAEIEEVVGWSLPSGAYVRWWFSAKSLQPLLDATNWRVTDVDLADRAVTFARMTGG